MPPATLKNPAGGWQVKIRAAKAADFFDSIGT
ncbi:MAG: hypothetical protein JWQ87_1750 [Candidatus Sulfotelmatobacter sp.]|nr:hypothetical protein [Candidatus Sulfotelmatobacter sp.]